MVVQLVFLGLWVAINLVVVFKYTARGLYIDLWVEQTWFGRIAGNLFYLPAWLIIGLYSAVILIVFFTLAVLGWLGGRMGGLASRVLKGDL